MPYTGFNMPDGVSNHDIPGFDTGEPYWPEIEDDREEDDE